MSRSASDCGCARESFSAGSVEPGQVERPSYGTPTTAAYSDRERAELAEGIV
ncbi:hypothetical protein ABZT06_01875 [Streptomyces sp. NPDC005483]|uniref:hypothetical protein n=1 Tax=Streptomyces sp. NPDC005483 TaxID=3154882 RepID=UPI0033ACDEF1